MAESGNRPKSSKCRSYCRVFCAHLFSHIGLSALVIGYIIAGAFIFEYLEAPNEISERSTVQQSREKCLEDIWDVTFDMNILYKKNWTYLIEMRLKQFENELVLAVKNDGYDGKEVEDRQLQWSFSRSLLYSITVITTIGENVFVP
ncbi:uncharacterized protein NPIL_377171 [Nephila pilipes]|uniref:Potassium channel domain-containing protein n=1 Tax=Nephila pilipes TaxID=299642 RepID=A0A8X6TIG6_NEPPI|nr:uncharacterized protein NPIL_377171 [Nephila pilipes]